MRTDGLQKKKLGIVSKKELNERLERYNPKQNREMNKLQRDLKEEIGRVSMEWCGMKEKKRKKRKR